MPKWICLPSSSPAEGLTAWNQEHWYQSRHSSPTFDRVSWGITPRTLNQSELMWLWLITERDQSLLRPVSSVTFQVKCVGRLGFDAKTCEHDWALPTKMFPPVTVQPPPTPKRPKKKDKQTNKTKTKQNKTKQKKHFCDLANSYFRWLGRTAWTEKQKGKQPKTISSWPWWLLLSEAVCCSFCRYQTELNTVTAKAWRSQQVRPPFLFSEESAALWDYIFHSCTLLLWHLRNSDFSSKW